MNFIHSYIGRIFTICLMFLLVTSKFAKAQTMVDTATPQNILPENNQIGSKWKLDFSDEFNGEAVNTQKWTVNVSTKSRAARPKLGISDWFWKSENVWLENGSLILQVKKHDYNTMYCGSIFSSGKYETKYGYFEARIKIADASKGTHTAFWLQGDGMSNVDGTANDGAEIDIFESAWLEDYTKCVVHIDGYGANHQANTKKFDTPGIHEGFHTWGFHWTENFMKIYYDGQLKASYTDPKWVVRSNEYLWLSDGASFGFEGDHFTREPVGVLTRAEVDYIRVWKDSSSTSTPAGNLIENGDFESSSTAYWAESNSDIIISESTFPVSEESNYCRMPGVPNGRSISQDVAVEPGAKYLFSFMGRIQNSHGASDVNNHGTNGPATLKGEILNGDDVLKVISTQENKNTKVSDTLSVPQGVSAVTIKISKNWNVAYVDDVELEKTMFNTVAPNFNKPSSSLSVYPNPVKNNLNIRNSQSIVHCKIYNNYGVIVKSINLNGEKELEMDVSSFKSGLYVVCVCTEDGCMIGRRVLVL